MLPVLPALSALATVLAAPTVGAADDHLLTGPEIRRELVGRDIHWWEADGWHSGSLHFLPDGTAEISVEHPGIEGDLGRWRLVEGRLCTAWGALRQGGEKCYALRRDGTGRYVTTGGNVFEIREFGA